MKKVGIIFSVLALSLVMSACSIGGKNNKEAMKVGDGGVYKSSDAGETFFPINKISDKKNISNESILDIVIDPNDGNIVYVGTKNSGIFRSVNGGQSWAESKSDFSYVRRIELDPSNENVLYIIAESNGEMALFKTVDRGINWERLLLQRDRRQPVVLDVLVDQKNPNVVYATDSTSGIYKSVDGGKEWKAIYWGDFPAVGIAMDNFNDNILYFITANQQIYITQDGGQTFKTAETGGPIYSVNASQTEKGVVYVLFQGGLYVSRDAGLNFELLPTLLKPDSTVANMVVTDPQDSNIIYLIAGKVIYKTINKGETWRAIPLKIKWDVSQFEINKRNNKEIYLGTLKPIRKGGSGLPFLKF